MGEEPKIVTQAEVDKYFKLWKTTEENLEKMIGRLDKSEAEKVELVTRIKNLKEEPPAPTPAPAYTGTEDDLTKVYTTSNPPRTQEEWDDLYAYSPSYAHDLKIAVKKTTGDWTDTRNKAFKVVQEKHPDMYRTDEKGTVLKFRVDANNNFIRDPSGNFIPDASGMPAFDTNSEKGKIWNEIANDPNFLQSAKAPVIIMEAMENRLKNKKEKEMKEKIDKDKVDKEKVRTEKVDKGGVVDGGGNPPAPKVKVEVKYNSEEERAHVQRQIDAGVYKNEEEYFITKKGNIGYGRGGF